MALKFKAQMGDLNVPLMKARVFGQRAAWRGKYGKFGDGITM